MNSDSTAIDDSRPEPADEQDDPDRAPQARKSRINRHALAWAAALGTFLTGVGTVAGFFIGGTTAHPAPATVVSTATETITQAASSVSPAGSAPASTRPTSETTGSLSAPPVAPRSEPATGTASAPPGTAVEPAPEGGGPVRFSGEVVFGDLHLDLEQPRSVPGKNVYRISEYRLYAEDAYQLIEWVSDGIPSRDECAAELVKRAGQDADHLVVGSRVCGKTPDGRVFHIHVKSIVPNAITAQVVVWEK